MMVLFHKNSHSLGSIVERDALLTQPLDGLVLVALRFVEGLLAVHHPCAGHVAQFFDELGGDLSHGALR